MATSHSRQRCALNDVPTRIEAVTIQHPITGRGRLTLQRTASVACPWSFGGFCDDEIVPLICPTCQIFGPNRRLRRPPATLHGVVFDIFGREPRRPGATAPSGRGRRLFRPLLKSWVLVWKDRKFLISQCGLTDTLSARAHCHSRSVRSRKWAPYRNPRDHREARASFRCASGVAFVDHIAYWHW